MADAVVSLLDDTLMPAPIPEENRARLESLLQAARDEAAGYGIGNWRLYNGRTAEGMDWFRRVYAGTRWAAFGYIAAEAELARAKRET